MSVVTSVTAVPSRLTIVWTYLQERGGDGVPVDELSSLVRPASLQKRGGDDTESSPAAMFNSVIGEMQNLGIVTRTEGGLLALTPEAANNQEGSAIQYLERILVDPKLADAHGQRAIAQAIAWFLTRDPYRPLPWGGGYRGDVTEDCGEDIASFDLTDEARSQQFVYWAIYLGFAWSLTADRKVTVSPDPTVALARSLPDLMPPDEPIAISELMAHLAERLPVLEGGTAREEVEALLPADRSRPEGQLSRSTSLAFARLETRGLLSIERLADASAINLDRGVEQQAVSHVSWRGER